MIAYIDRGMIGKGWISILKFLNGTLYKLIKVIFSLILNISKTTFNDALLGDFQTRMYIIIAIYMLFKLAFSLIGSIVNPDKLLDKQAGMQKIIPRTIISLAMLIMIPTIFEFALDAQDKIVAFVPRIILGKTTDSSVSGVEDTAEGLAATTLSAFITYNAECSANGVSSGDMVNPTLSTNDIDKVLDAASESCPGHWRTFKYEFSGLVSLMAGLVLLFILISYAIDIAIRTIKLGILQMLAPIPVISYIDPKSEKGGSFGNWMKECISTYVELFIKLGVLYFAILLLGNLSNSSTEAFNYPSDTGIISVSFINAALIIGVFMFMGSATDFICNILGIKHNKGSGGLFKGLAGIAGAAGIGAAALSAARTNYRGNLESQAARGLNPNKGKAIASAIFGGAAGIATAGKAVAGAKGNKWSAAQNAINKRNGAYMKSASEGATFGGEMGAYLQQTFTGETSADKIERKFNKNKERFDNSKTLYDYLESQGVKKSSGMALNSNGRQATYGNTVFNSKFTYDDFVNAREVAKKKGDATFTVGGATLNTFGSEANFAETEMKKQLGNLWYLNNQSDVKAAELASKANIELTTNSNLMENIKKVKDDAEKDMLIAGNALDKAKANRDAVRPK